MKSKLLLIAAAILMGLSLMALRAQDTPAPTAPPAAQNPQPPQNPPPRRFPPALRRSGNSYGMAINMLRRAKRDLEMSKDDYDGHRQSALDACDKALAELEAVQTAAQAAAAKAAAQQAPPPPTQTPQPSAPTPAPPAAAPSQ